MNDIFVLMFNDIPVNIFLRMIALLGSHLIFIACASLLSLPFSNPNFLETISYAETITLCSHFISFLFSTVFFCKVGEFFFGEFYFLEVSINVFAQV